MQEGNTRYLKVYDTETGKVYGKWSLEESGEFSIEFIHSVNQSPVKDIYFREGDQIRLRSAHFFSLGAGVSADLEEGLILRYDSEGAFVITGYKNIFYELNYIVGTISDHILLINGEEISLRELCGRNTAITMRLRRF